MRKEYAEKAFTEEEKNILYDACLCYADELVEARNMLRNTPGANEIVEEKIKCVYRLGQEITKTFLAD